MAELKPSYIVFDVESVVDEDLVAAVGYKKKDENDFVPHTFQTPVAVGVLEANSHGVIRSYTLNPDVDDLSLAALSEELTKRFCDLMERRGKATLVTFNGRSFDLPLMELMAFKFCVKMPNYFQDKYGPRHRFGDAHFDLMEWFTNFGACRLNGGLNLLAKMIGRHGKSGIAGGDVDGLYRAGKLAEINQYCLDDVRDTYEVFRRVMSIKGMQ